MRKPGDRLRLSSTFASSLRNVLIWHVPNGGLRTKAEAARLKWIGVLAGVLDLTLVLAGGAMLRTGRRRSPRPAGSATTS